MRAQSVAEYYHEATKYEPETLARRQHQLDWARQPAPFKDYPGITPIDLGRFLPAEPQELFDHELQAAGRFQGAEKELNDLSHLLYFTNGVTAIVRHPDRPFYMRAAPSAGGLYPTEIYLVSRGTLALPPGLYNYQVRNHSLVQIHGQDLWTGLTDACLDHPALAAADLAVVFSGVFFRSSWRYGDRAYRRILLDTGHVMGNLALYAPLTGRLAAPVGGFVDDALNDLLLLPAGEEEVLAVVALVPADSALSDYPPRALPSKDSPSRGDVPEGRQLLAVHDASKIALRTRIKAKAVAAGAEMPVWMKLTTPIPLGPHPLDWADGLSEAILKRRSTRAFSSAPLTRDQLAAILSTYAGTEPLTFDLGSLKTFVAVHRVEELDPGCYHFEPASQTLRQIRFKDLTREVQYLCLNQELGGQAAAVVFHTADLPQAVARWGDRAYRYLHLDAGHLGQRLNLAAVRQELGASGIGGFFDDKVNDLLGIPEAEAIVYITTLGVPARPGL